MSELTGKQIETLRIGLQIGFGEPQTLAMFLREKLDKIYVNYVAERDKYPEACFKIVTDSETEGWWNDLIREAHKARPKNPNIAKVGRELDLIAAQDANEDWSLGEAAAADAEPPLWRTYNPYRGMLALREQDANYLFGRDEDVDRFIDAIEMEPSKILLALGASGVGKSSLIFAGVLAALRRRSRKSRKPWPVTLEDSHKWPHLVLTPEAEPLYSLASAFVRQWIDETEPDFRKKTNEWRTLLADGDSLDGLVKAADAAWKRKLEDPPPRYLIYVDQGEELYTRGRREPGLDHTDKEKPEQKEARRFSELLAEAAAHPRLIVLMSVRSDFLGQLQADKRLSDGHPEKIFDVHRQLNINPLGEDGLKQVITRPAEMLGVSFENGLDSTLARATREEIGGLPLLSYTLETLWQEMQARDDGAPILRWQATDGEAIDIAKKLADRAEAFVKRYKGQEPILQRLFCVQFAHVPAQGDPTRQRAFLDELSSEEVDLVKELADPMQRIVVAGESEGRAIAEVAHEKLFTAWGRLQTWLGSRRDFYAWATQIEAWRKEWEKAGRRPGDLLIGRPLEHAKAYFEASEADIPAADAAFVRESQRTNSRWKTIRRVLSVNAFIVIALAAVIAAFLWQAAETERVRAEGALARLFAERAWTANAGGETNRALRYALAGWKLAPQHAPHYRAALAAIMSSNPILASKQLHEGRITALGISPDGQMVVTGGMDGKVKLSSTLDLQPMGPPLLHALGVILAASFTPDGSRVITVGRDNTIRMWDVSSGDEIARLLGHTDSITEAIISPDGTRLISTSRDGTGRLWGLKTGAMLSIFKVHQDGLPVASFSWDGGKIVTGSSRGEITIFDAFSGRKIRSIFAVNSAITTVNFALNDNFVIAGTESGSVLILSSSSYENHSEPTTLEGHQGAIRAATLSEKGDRAYVIDDKGLAYIWDVTNVDLLLVNEAKTKEAGLASFSSNARYAVATRRNGSISVWDAAAARNLIEIQNNLAQPTVISWYGDRRIITGDIDGRIVVYNLDDLTRSIKMLAETACRELDQDDTKFTRLEAAADPLIRDIWDAEGTERNVCR